VSGIDRRRLALLSVGHGCADLCQGAVPALLPFLVLRDGLSLAAAAALLSAATIGSSLVQPLFGVWADRLSSPVLLPAGVALGSVGLGLTGLAGSYALLACALIVSSLGVAAFHPEAARMAGFVSGDERARGMSYFSVGGNAGFALGPVFVAPLVALFGLGATPLLALPGLAVAALLVRELPRMRAVAGGAAGVHGGAPPPALWGAFSRLTAAAVSRTVAFFALQAFVPLYAIERFGLSEAGAGALLAVMLVAGAAGTLIGGRLADRAGRRGVMVWAMVPLALLLLALPHAGLAAFVLLLIGVGLAIDAPFSVTVVFGQELLPGRAGLASGITIGAAIGVGGLLATALGAVADATSIATVLELLPLFALVALALSVSLPEPRRQLRTAVPSGS
jgi:FSR family fosmidomycin resistance protein-like MFS transporter